jgi:hypothetical protein
MTPYAWTKKTPPNYDLMMQIAEVGRVAIKNKNGNEYKIGQISHLLCKKSKNVLQ